MYKSLQKGEIREFAVKIHSNNSPNEPSNFHLYLLSSAIWTQTHFSNFEITENCLVSLIYKAKYRSALHSQASYLNRIFKKIARNFKLPLIGETQIEVSEKSRVFDCVRFCALTSFTAAVHRVAHICPFSA